MAGMNKEGKKASANAAHEDAARTRRYVLATIALLSLALIATQLFLNQTSVGSARFLSSTLMLWSATVLVVLALLILAAVLGRNLIKLYFERRSGQVGSRFKAKMVTIFAAFSLLPALLLFLMAYGLINASIKQWFSAPADQMLDNSKAIADQYYEDAGIRHRHYAQVIASESARLGGASPEAPAALALKLDELRRDFLLDDVRVFDRGGRLLGMASGPAAQDIGQSAAEEMVARALKGESEFRVDRVSADDALREVVRATAPVHRGDEATAGAVLVQTLIPQGAYFKAYSVREAYSVYRALQSSQPALRFNFLLILALSTLLIVFAFSWFAMYLAKRITVPIQALAEGAVAVAAGNLDYRVNCAAFDELESLVQSFNRMTRELQDNKRNIEAAQDSLQQTNVELDNRRRYIETILQAIATGVISLDGDYRVRTMNRAAIQMLGVQGPTEGAGLDEVVRGSACGTLRMLLHKATVLGTVVRNIELSLPDKTLHVATTITPLIDGSGQRSGWVLVLDDLTELLRVEKMAAWQEVARRLAHEIKNPLTPIQLSAERLLRRYRQLAPPEAAPKLSAPGRQAEFASFDGLLQECVQTIIHEADSLKNLVDEFSRFARLPQVRTEQSDLHRVIESALSLYNGRTQDVRFAVDFDPGIPPLWLDPEQMKRVLVNLMDNALEAMAGSPHAKDLLIRTRRDGMQRSVRIEVNDTGRGFPEGYRDSLFLPYFSTRKGGTGLGLAIVRQIVTEHHGRVRAEPNAPRGTRIIIDLPMAQA